MQFVCNSVAGDWFIFMCIVRILSCNIAFSHKEGGRGDEKTVVRAGGRAGAVDAGAEGDGRLA